MIQIFLCGVYLKVDNVPCIIGEQNPDLSQLCSFGCSLWNHPANQFLAFIQGHEAVGATEAQAPTERAGLVGLTAAVIYESAC